MTTILIANLITAIAVIFGLAAVCRLGHIAAGGQFDPLERRLGLRAGGRATAEPPAQERRAA